MAFSWTAPRTWVGAEKPTAATLNSHIRDNFEALNGYVLKAADESVTSSTTLQNDDHLFFTIPQAGTYLVDAYLYASSAANAAGDLNVTWSFPTGTMHHGAMGLGISLASGNEGSAVASQLLSAVSGASFVSVGLSTSTTFVRLHGILIATASGTLRLMWCQNSSNANASTVKSGSHMVVKQVA